jgi:hypothetical protein
MHAIIRTAPNWAFPAGSRKISKIIRRFKMRKIGFVFCIMMLLGLAAPMASAAILTLDMGYSNQDGVLAPLSVSSLPKQFSYTISTPGTYFLGVYLDFDIDSPDPDQNGFYNEQGWATNFPASGQSWEIDEPGYAFGDLWVNFKAGNLDNKLWDGVLDSNYQDDVAMALGWDFTLTSGQKAVINYFVSDTKPNSGFYLTQFDPDSDAGIYFSSSLKIENTSTVPEPSLMIMSFLGLGAVGLASRFRKSA